ncbi:unnamed protein product, partial [Effrenium voratum]
ELHVQIPSGEPYGSAVSAAADCELRSRGFEASTRSALKRAAFRVCTRCCANVSPRCFVGCMHYGIFPSLDCLQGCLSRNLLRQPAKGTPPEIKAEWLMLDEPHSDSSRVILYLPGGGFVARDHTASVFAARVLARLAAKRQALPAILVLNYQLPAHPEHTKQEIEATIQWLRAQGFTDVLVAGDSAGGYLAVQTFLEQSHRICGAVGICPVLDFTLSNQSHTRNSQSCFLTRRFTRYAREQFLGVSSSDPTAEATARQHSLWISSIRTETGTPARPLFLVACEQDPLVDDVQNFAARAATGAVQVCSVQGEASFHISMLLPLLASKSHRNALDQMAEYIHQML